ALPAAVSVLEQAVGRLSVTAGSGSGTGLRRAAELAAGAGWAGPGPAAPDLTMPELAAPGPVASGPETADPVAPLAELLARTRSRLANADGFAAAYQRYCWPVEGLDGVRLAPFALLAADGAAPAGRPHRWHLAAASRLAAADAGLFTMTRHVFADTSDPASCSAAADWWRELTAAGGEGMVVKPADGLVRGPRGLAQPGLKVRGREYLRII